MKKQIIVGLSFNDQKKERRNHGRDNIVRLTKEWIEDRLAIFMNYTLRSLKAQTNQDFLALVRYDEKSEETLRIALDHYHPLPSNIKFVGKESYTDKVAQHLKKGRSDYYYFVRLDSDDMYHRTYMQQLHDHIPKEGKVSLISRKGYKYDLVHHRLGEDTRKSPPFYALIYKTKDFLDGQRYDLSRGHNYAIKLPHEILPDKNYVYIIHHSNVKGKWHNDVLEEDPMKINRILSEYRG
ncbi:glycosyltransferase [Ammoniphilus sp. YIM 78166]|uniref:glycosyltransferase n=1 Tax=Ammoniphilus sp. YIM 78166 TaxID=1644106 RepID=UPI00107034A9|nr:glycosyltransferase [Ammoniphilus sp. YIM 78166]